MNSSCRIDRVVLIGAFLLAGLLTHSISCAEAAQPPTLWKACPEGSTAGSCERPGAIAVDPTTGHLYAIDIVNRRIDEFSAWGAFLRSWGWGVADGAPELQVCGPTPGSDAVTCRPGLEGAGAGEFSEAAPKGIAVDSLGDVYVYESQGCTGGSSCNLHESNRIQKFDPQGNFLLTFGRQVNLTKVHLREQQEAASEPVTVTSAEENICAASSGDSCGPGVKGGGDEEFGGEGQLYEEPHENFLAVGPEDSIYVGGQGLIQRYRPDGSFASSISLPGVVVESLAVDESGDLFVAEAGENNTVKLSPSGSALCAVETGSPSALAFAGGTLVAMELHHAVGARHQIVHSFEDNCAPIPDSEFDPGLEFSTGVAANVVTESGEVAIYVSNSETGQSYIKAFSPVPDRPTPFDQPPQVPPSIADQFAASVGSGTATLEAEVNPHFFADTTVYVEYGTGACTLGGCQVAPAPPTLLGSGRVGEPVRASVQATGLTPERTYHFRFVAESGGGGPVRGVGGMVGIDGAEGEFETFPAELVGPACPNSVFRAGLSARLPDCRAYELVSPVQKNGGDVAAGKVTNEHGTLAEVSAGGERATYSSIRPFGEPQAAPLVNQLFSVRSVAGWETRSISPPRSSLPLYGPGIAGQYKSFEEELCGSWLMQDSEFGLTPGASSGTANAYRRTGCNAEAAYELLTAVGPPGFGHGSGEIPVENYLPVPQGHSADGAHTILRADGALTANACKTAGIFQLYETSPEGPLRTVSILPPEGNASRAACKHSTVGTVQGDQTDGFRMGSMLRAVSADGQRIYWTETEDARTETGTSPGEGPGRLMVRVNATQAPSKVVGGECTEASKACTVLVSEAANPACIDEIPCAQFLAADPSGEEAIYQVGPELLAFDLATRTSTPIASAAQGVVGESEDLSRIYLVSTEVLSGVQGNAFGAAAQSGSDNLYLEEGGRFTFIATLAPEEGSLGGHNQRYAFSPASLRPGYRTSRITPDGSHLAFTSTAPLTKYDNTDRHSGEADVEAFLYDAEAGGPGSLACISCNPSGSRPAGAEAGEGINGHPGLWFAGKIPGWSEQLRPSRLLADDGDRLFFESYDALVPRDTNGVDDAYEWERSSGRAGCEELGAEIYAPKSGGCLSLISSGTGTTGSELLESSASGTDIFFTTEDSLVPQDPGAIDVYDAREDGGFPSPGVPAGCEGEDCQDESVAPSEAHPASAIPGPGNPPRKCPKGTKKTKGKKGGTRCVKVKKKHRKPKHHHQSHHAQHGKSQSKTKKNGGAGR
jgi:hypothetical protein